MDFFQEQEVARKKTGLLVLYFVLAVICIIVAIYAALAAILGVTGGMEPSEVSVLRLWDPTLFGMVSAGTLSVIGVGSLYRVASLASGGRSVAELLQGRLIPPDTTDPEERRLLNVVEEMAIASGVPVPPVYLLGHESSINAFAAGHTPGDAVIGVTRGTVQNLSRDELQGVIAHEFSHILNGDMKLNLRLMGILFGIMAISLIGYFLLRSSTGVVYRVGARDDDKKGGNPLPLIGLALYVIGYAGVIGGRLIKSAISRQREYLADASAVQFTRNPDGIAGALKKIGAVSEGSRIEAPDAEEASHMFFGNALAPAWFGLMATHPPLADRIKRIDPSFDGDFKAVRAAMREGRPLPGERAPSQPQPSTRARIPLDPSRAVATVGTVDLNKVVTAAALLDSISTTLAGAARQPFEARALVFALLMDREDGELRENQLANLRSRIDGPTYELTVKLVPTAIATPAETRLPLIELALPALRRLSPGQYRDFKAAVEQLMAADRRIDLFEFALQRLLLRHLGPQFEPKSAWPEPVRAERAEAVQKPAITLLAAMARAGEGPRSSAPEAFRAGVKELGWTASGAEVEMPEQVIGLGDVRQALDALGAAAPRLKKDVVRACAAVVSLDGQATAEEFELLRAVCDTLDCPMPPLIAPSS